MSTESGRGRGGKGGLARSTGSVAAKGAGLIAVAVIIGIVLLQVVDDGTTGPVGDSSDETSAPTTTTTAGDETTTTTVVETPARTPDQVRVVVLNTGAPTGSAATLRQQLEAAGYTSQEPVGDWAIDRPGNAVFCRAGLEREAAALAVAVGEGTTTDAFPDPPPAGSENADCIVTIGAAA
jgi:hypothetical protein